MTDRKTILLQGAMHLEISYFLSHMTEVKPVTYAGFNFWQGKSGLHSLVLSQTGVGTAMAGAATVLGIEKFQPDLIINQGTAGAYAAELTYGDIVIGKQVFNGNAAHTRRDGSLQYIDMTSLEQEDDFNKMFLPKPKYFLSEAKAVAAALAASSSYQEGKVVSGVIASFDQWNLELAKIKRLQLETGALCEEMEAGAVAAISTVNQVPFLAVRVISNNNTLGTTFQGETALMGQRFVEAILNKL